MESNFRPKLIYKGYIENTENYNITITSPDLAELNGCVVPPNAFVPFELVVKEGFKLHTETILNLQEEPTGVYMAIVDADF